VRWRVRHCGRSSLYVGDISVVQDLISRCASAYLAGTTVQGFSGCDKGKSSMHSGKVPDDEMHTLMKRWLTAIP